MSDLISKRELYYKISETYKKGRLSWGANEIFKDIIGECDSVENKGTWIYDKSIYNWRCSECGETPPPTGYVGKAEFMATHFKFCNYCGARMEGCEE